MKILITGVAGFIGSNLADKLLRIRNDKFEVQSCRKKIEKKDSQTSNPRSKVFHIIGVDNLAYGVREQIPEGVEFHQLDIRSKEISPLFEGVDYVFHLAAKNCINDCQADPVETAEINITGTVNVFESAKKVGAKKVIYAESSAMYEGSDTFPTPEKDVNAESFYAISKLCSNIFAKSYKRFFGLKTTGIRYFNVYGPRQDYRRTIPPVMSAFVISLLKGNAPIIYGTGEKRRDFVYIDDVNNFHLLCLKDNRTDGKVFNIGSGRNYSILEIYKIISSLLEKKIAPIFKPDLPGEAFENLADVAEAKKLGWQPETNIKDGLKKIIKYIKKEIKKGNIN